MSARMYDLKDPKFMPWFLRTLLIVACVVFILSYGLLLIVGWAT